MTELYERVIELQDYYDGPREGTAYFNGRTYSFKSRMLDVYGPDQIVDLFDLTPLDGSSEPVQAMAGFRRVGFGPLPPGEWPVLEVWWRQVSDTGV
jgi:hypothetical protein